MVISSFLTIVVCKQRWKLEGIFDFEPITYFMAVGPVSYVVMHISVVFSDDLLYVYFF